MAFCYGRHTPLYVGDSVILSQRGVQQGDPCGPLGFAWGIQDVLEEVAAKVSWQAWYLDDGILLGSLDQLTSALCHLRHQFAERGLTINLAKCHL